MDAAEGRASTRVMARRGSRAIVSGVGLWLLALSAGCPTPTEGTAAKAAPLQKSAPVVAADVAAKAPEPAGPEVVLSPPGRDPVRVRVELAQKEQERRVGLMYRKHLDAEAGMLFLFEAQQPLTFWMRNTYVPLDMIFITDALAVLGVVENAEPLTDAPRAVAGMSRYVLEVNAGYSRSHGIAGGTLVRFEGFEASAAPGAGQ